MELSKRQAEKQQTRNTLDRKKLEKKLKTIVVENISEEFPHMGCDKHEKLVELLTVGTGSHYLSLRESAGRLKNSMFSTDSITVQMCVFPPAINMKIKTKL